MVIGKYGEECISRHSVMIHDRGGVRRIGALTDIAEVEWNRERDVMSGAKIIISGRSCSEQAPFINSIAPRRHEMVIYRGNQRVWEGPILEGNWYSNRVEIIANDVVDYVRGTPMTKAWPNSDNGGQVYMTERIRDILEYELTTSYDMVVSPNGVPATVAVPRWEELDPPANVLPFLEVRSSTGPQGILTRSEVEAFEMMVGEHLQNLAEGGLDYTTVGRKLLIWDSAQTIGRTRILTDADFYGELRVIAAGGEHAAIGHISAQRDEQGGDEPVDPMSGIGNAGAPDPFYGVWTRLVSLSSEEGTDTPTQLVLNSQARRQLVGRNPVPTEILIPSGGGLRLSHDLQINELVPGVIMPVRATLNLRPVQQDQRLDKLTVRETPAGETVQVSLSPAGILGGA
ncbi:minor tail protein [Microbacterium phage FuzzBuster]|uniref:Minor tail protein n=1 Tax=Microbacterium phage FuzzBuster TaxID=2590935 RepID=A0A516KV22_9CAUD|nr:minor tail protein [Microbacterium phage FuzzBuster]